MHMYAVTFITKDFPLFCTVRVLSTDGGRLRIRSGITRAWGLVRSVATEGLCLIQEDSCYWALADSCMRNTDSGFQLLIIFFS